MPPAPPRDSDAAILALLGRVIEAVSAIASGTETRTNQIRDLAGRLERVEAELRRQGDVAAEAARVAALGIEERSQIRAADAAALAQIRATKEAGGATLARLLQHPAVVVILTALLGALGGWLGLQASLPPALTTPPVTTPP